MESKHPELRFSGFDEEWNKRKLGEIVSIFKGEQRGKQEISIIRTDENPYPVYNGGRNVSGYTDEYNRENKVMLSEGGASAGFVNYYKDKYWSGGHNFTIDNLENNLDFIYAILSANQDKLYGLKVGSGLPNIQLNSIVNFEVSLPSIEEQKKLGFFFKNMNDVITLQQQELTTLKQTKQGFLQKMFPKEGEKVPEVRFPGFSCEWKKHKLSDLMVFSNGINAPKGNYGHGRKMISVMDILDKQPIKYKNIRSSVKVDKKNEEKNKVESGDLIFVRSSEIPEEVGWAKAYLDEEYALYSGFSIRGKKKKNFDAYFVELALNFSNRKQIERKAGGSTRFNVSQSILNSIEILMPENSEQTKISSFFKQLDKTITLHQRELELLQLTKKAFLQKLFV